MVLPASKSVNLNTLDEGTPGTATMVKAITGMFQSGNDVRCASMKFQANAGESEGLHQRP